MADDISGRSVAYALVAELLPPNSAIEIGEEGSEREVNVIFENDDWDPEDVGEPFVMCEWRPSPKNSAMDGSSLREAGIMRFELRIPLGEGALRANALADELESRYPPTKRMSRGDWAVTVMSIGRSAMEKLTAWRQIFVDVAYIAVRA